MARQRHLFGCLLPLAQAVGCTLLREEAQSVGSTCVSGTDSTSGLTLRQVNRFESSSDINLVTMVDVDLPLLYIFWFVDQTLPKAFLLVSYILF